jgi:hypothetical protein
MQPITADGKSYFHVQTARGHSIKQAACDSACYRQLNVGKSQFCNIGHATLTLFQKISSQTIMGMYKIYWTWPLNVRESNSTTIPFQWHYPMLGHSALNSSIWALNSVFTWFCVNDTHIRPSSRCICATTKHQHNPHNGWVIHIHSWMLSRVMCGSF